MNGTAASAQGALPESDDVDGEDESQAVESSSEESLHSSKDERSIEVEQSDNQQPGGKSSSTESELRELSTLLADASEELRQHSSQELLRIGMPAVSYLVEAICQSGASNSCYSATVGSILQNQQSELLLDLRRKEARCALFEEHPGKYSVSSRLEALEQTMLQLIDCELAKRIQMQPWQRAIDFECSGKLFNFLGERLSRLAIDVFDRLSTEDGRTMLANRITELAYLAGSALVSPKERDTISAQIRTLGMLLSPKFIETRRFWLRLALAEGIDPSAPDAKEQITCLMLEAQRIGGPAQREAIARAAVQLGLDGSFDFVCRFQAQGGDPEHLNRRGCRASRYANIQAMPFSRPRLRVIAD
ncbi:MAG: hypothetical protein K2Z81_14695 [Cyanobacteria bacterium]|nr:hypothetical protein [Cyanobacteriota bacterium]